MMRVLKIEGEGLVTSFRYPFFVVGRQPTFEMPPPATIYGHICSALGDVVDPAGLHFGYWFRHEGKAEDLEHMQAISRAGGSFSWQGQKVRENLSAVVQPLQREFLFHPRLVLYINHPEWEGAFRSPRYAVVLGRSQDLFSYNQVSVVDLEEASEAYLEHTLLPGALGERVRAGIAIAMPRYLDYAAAREPVFGQYVMVAARLRPSDLRHAGPFLVDPETPLVDGCHRAVIFHDLVDQ